MGMVLATLLYFHSIHRLEVMADTGEIS